jgi:hypothetical protein
MPIILLVIYFKELDKEAWKDMCSLVYNVE